MAFAQLTSEEKLAQAQEAFEAFNAAQTVDEVRATFKRFYLTIGHKALGRMLIGQTPEKALRLS